MKTFAEFGKVIEVTLVKESHAEVKYLNKLDAFDAKNQCNNRPFDGKPINIEIEGRSVVFAGRARGRDMNFFFAEPRK